MLLHFSTIDRGDSTGCRRIGEQVIDNFVEWAALWDEHTAILSRRPPIPDVDFEKETVIAYFVREKPSSGYGVEITAIELQGDPKNQELVVTIKEYTPARLSSDVITQPYHIVRVPKVRFSKVIFESA